MQNTEDIANGDAESGDEFGVLSGDDEPDELDESEDERHRDDDDCFGMQNTSCGNFSQVLDRWKNSNKTGKIGRSQERKVWVLLRQTKVKVWVLLAHNKELITMK